MSEQRPPCGRHVYNLSRDKPDKSDEFDAINLKINIHRNSIVTIDHRRTCPDIVHQGDIGSCTASALSCIFYHNMLKFNYADPFIPSRLFLYYNTRAMKHTVNMDIGGSMRDGLKALHSYGMCPETMWEYDIKKYKNKPPDKAYVFGQSNKGIVYSRIPQHLTQLKQCLLDGYLFAFGMSVYSNFEDGDVEKTGIVKPPTKNDIYLGGHAVCAVGFNDERNTFVVRNSWGSEWGDHGYCYLPYDFVTNPDLVYDIWTFRNQPDTISFTNPDDEIKKRRKCILC